MHILKQDELFSLIMSLLPQKAHIIEVGAYTGNHTLKMIESCKDAQIYCFEPVPDIYQKLKKKVSNYPSIYTYNLAISNYTGNTLLYLANNPLKPNKLSSASSLKKPKNRLDFSPIQYDKTIIVETITLDSWFKNYPNIIPIDLLWIDAQGHEYEILEGAHNLLSHVHYIHTEVHFNDAYEEQKDYTEIINFLKKYSFVEIARDFEHTKDWFFGNILFDKK